MRGPYKWVALYLWLARSTRHRSPKWLSNNSLLFSGSAERDRETETEGAKLELRAPLHSDLDERQQRRRQATRRHEVVRHWDEVARMDFVVV